MEGGRYFSTLQVASMHKCMNVEIEDNFARAAMMRSSGRGRVLSFL